MVSVLLSLFLATASFAADLESLPATNVGIDTTTHTGTAVGTKTAADTMLIDGIGNAFGTASSPFVVSNVTNSLGSQGKQFVGSTPAISIIAAGNFKALLSNPTGSGVTLIVNAIAFTNSNLNLTAIGTLVLDPTGSLPVTTAYKTNFQLMGSAPKATILYDGSSTSTLMTGGTNIVSLGVPPGRSLFNQGFFYVPPGHSLGINSPYSGIGTVEFEVYWSEI